eukprot:6205245-Pleurochrysis_carterae.AAC.7
MHRPAIFGDTKARCEDALHDSIAGRITSKYRNALAVPRWGSADCSWFGIPKASERGISLLTCAVSSSHAAQLAARGERTTPFQRARP